MGQNRPHRTTNNMLTHAPSTQVPCIPLLPPPSNTIALSLLPGKMAGKTMKPRHQMVARAHQREGEGGLGVLVGTCQRRRQRRTRRPGSRKPPMCPPRTTYQAPFLQRASSNYHRHPRSRRPLLFGPPWRYPRKPELGYPGTVLPNHTSRTHTRQWQVSTLCCCVQFRFPVAVHSACFLNASCGGL